MTSTGVSNNELPEKHLTGKQEAFCYQYLQSHSGADAAIAAGYKPHSAKNIACELLRKPHVAKFLRELEERTRSAAIADVMERKEILTIILRSPISTQDRITAIRELNRMELIGTPNQPMLNNVVVIKVVYDDCRTRDSDSPAQTPSGAGAISIIES